MWFREKSGKARKLEFRLWIGYIGYILTICGIAVFLVQLDRAKTWGITPLIGVAVAAGGNQVVTTVLTTYAVDCYFEDAAAIGVFISFVRQVWGFIGPFWYEFSPQYLPITPLSSFPSPLFLFLFPAEYDLTS